MNLKRLLMIPMLVLTMVLCTSVTALASEPELEEAPTENLEDASSTTVVPEYTVVVKYTDDSSTLKGISYETYVDPATLTVCFKIVDDLSLGHIIYDNPDTAYIDGIRVNGDTVDTLTIPIAQGTVYEIAVRTVYEDNLLGDIAKVIDGNFDFKALLENPIALLIGIYYVLSILAIVVAAVSAFFSKSKKVKTADEIAAKVDESADVAIEKVKTEVTDTVLLEMSPILQTILDGIQNVVTAITLSTSKCKEAPLAMLDTLQKTAESNNLNSLIDDIRKTVSDGISKEDDDRSANLRTLQEIAESATSVVNTLNSSTDATYTTKSVF